MNHRLKTQIASLLCALAAGACADEDAVVAETPAFSEAGVTGGTLADRLTVRALDATTGQPITGAAVRLGAGAAAHAIGYTGSGGTLSVTGIAGEAQTVTVSAPGYASASWGVVQSAIVSLPLEPIRVSPRVVTLDVQLAGWSDLAAPAAGSYRVARFAYSKPNTLSALEATVEPFSECRQPGGETCSVRLTVPSDSSMLLAVIAEADDSGTPSDPSDDVFSMTHIALFTHLSTRAVDRPLQLALLDPSLTARATVRGIPGSGGVFDEVVGVPGVSVDGQILLYPALGVRSTSFLVPTAAGAPENAKLWAVATASKGGISSWSRIYERGIDLPHSAEAVVELEASSFLDLPRMSEGTDSTFELTSSGEVQRLEFATPNGGRLNALLFPAQPGFTLPAGVLEGAPNASSVEVFDSDLNPSEFRFIELAQRAKRIAYVQTGSL